MKFTKGIEIFQRMRVRNDKTLSDRIPLTDRKMNSNATEIKGKGIK